MAIKKCWAVFHNDPVTVQTSSMGYSIVEKNKGIQHLYTVEDTALDVANEIAGKHPGTQVVVLEAKIIFESKIPETIMKSWKENGEVLPIEKSIKEKKVKARFDPMDAIARQMLDEDENRAPARPPRPRNAQADIRPGAVQFFQAVDLNPIQQGEAGGQPPNPNPRGDRFV